MFFKPVFFLVPLLCISHADAQETERTEVDTESKKLREVVDRAVDQFQVFPARDPSAAMEPKSVLRWTNDERDSHSVGVVTLWIDRGQPAAALASYYWSERLYFEFDIISREPVICRQKKATIWQPKSGLVFQTIPNSPAVESAAPARLRQMKVLSEQFSATMLGWRADKSDRAELRRLPRELYRYQPEDPKVVDGAVFAFVQGTDPEALLLIEAVEQNAKPEWQYAFVRQTSGELEGRHEGKTVWRADRFPPRNVPTGTGITIIGPELKTELAR